MTVRVFFSMQHMFLDCPHVAPAVDWLLDVWAAVAGPAGRPPRTAAVLLADDDRSWSPAGDGAVRALWTALRVSWLHAVWVQRCRRQANQQWAVTAAGVAAATAAAVGRLIRRDFARVAVDARSSTAAPAHWFRGTRDPQLGLAAFLTRWGLGGVLCRVDPPAPGEALGQLHVLFTTAAPVLAPAAPADLAATG
jgi:hypothetical protein